MADSGEKDNTKTLIVEDNESFRQSFRERLQRLFPAMTIQEAGEGSEALRKVESFHPSLIFMDIHLPGENGLQLTKKIRAKNPDMSIVIVTNHDIPEYRDAAFQDGANDFIPKDALSYDRIEKLVKSIMPRG